MARPALARRAALTRVLGLAERAGDSRILVSVTGPGGSGKTTALEALAEALSNSGVAVSALRDRNPSDHSGAVLVDDAHLLGVHELGNLEELVRAGKSHVVLARRPWPQPPELRRLMATMDESHVPVTLGAFTASEVAEYAHRVLGRTLPGEAVDDLLRQTGGMPWLVRMVVLAWEIDADGLPDPLVPDAVRAHLSSELEALEQEICDLLLDLAVGFDLSGHMSPPVIGKHDSGHLVARAKAEGLLGGDARAVPLISEALLSTAPVRRVRERRTKYLDAVAEEGLSVELGTAVAMARAGVRHPLLARTLLAAGDETVVQQPGDALELYGEAARAGADEAQTAARRARALAFVGDLDAAARIVDDLLARPDAPDALLAADVAGAIWSQRGMLHRSADVYRWLGPDRVGASAPLAAVTMLGTGDLAGAEGMLAARTEGSPTDLGVSLNLMAEGLHSAVVGSPPRALSMLMRSSDTLNALGAAPPMPMLPAVLASLVATQSGDGAAAASVLDDALRAGQGGPAMRSELLLRRAWAAMLQDHLAQAGALLGEARRHGIHGRQVCLAAAVEVAMARRAYDPAEILVAWRRARTHLHRWPLDLFMIQPLAELQMAAARVGESEWLATPLKDTWDILDSLGHPTLWSVPLHWGSVHAAILSDRPSDLRVHAAALHKASQGSRLAAAMAPASRAWAAVMARSFAATEVEEAAAGLADVGLSWDGARLLSQAATRATDRKDQARLLARARDLRPPTEVTAPLPAPAPASARPEREAPPAARAQVATKASVLSEREREVAAMVLAGSTYREIGAALFMSPRTAEHHVARMRTRLGASDRADLLIRLRAEMGDDARGA